MTVHHWPPRPALSRAKARADVNRLLDMLEGTGVSYSVHPMQQQSREDHLEYYERRAREAQAQADAHKGEVYDDDLDTWRRVHEGDENDPTSLAWWLKPHVPEPECIEVALCGPMGRVV